MLRGSCKVCWLNCDNEDDTGWFLADEDCWEGWWSVLACSLVVVESDSWCVHPTAFWTGEGLGWRWLGCVRSFCLLRLSFAALYLYASKLRYLFSLMSANCLGLRPPAATTDGWFPPVQTVSSAGLCNAFLERYDRAFHLGARWRLLLWACVHLPSLWRGQPSAAALEARLTLCCAGWLPWGLLRLT